jgi:hypothetical protein
MTVGRRRVVGDDDIVGQHSCCFRKRQHCIHLIDVILLSIINRSV